MSVTERRNEIRKDLWNNFETIFDCFIDASKDRARITVCLSDRSEVDKMKKLYPDIVVIVKKRSLTRTRIPALLGRT